MILRRSDAGEVQGGIPAKVWVWHIDSAKLSQLSMKTRVAKPYGVINLERFSSQITWPHHASSHLIMAHLTSSHLTTTDYHSLQKIISSRVISPYLISSITAPTKSMSLTKTSSFAKRNLNTNVVPNPPREIHNKLAPVPSSTYKSISIVRISAGCIQTIIRLMGIFEEFHLSSQIVAQQNGTKVRQADACHGIMSLHHQIFKVIKQQHLWGPCPLHLSSARSSHRCE